MKTKTFSQKTILVILLLFVIKFSVVAQKAPIKYGKIDKADLEMKVYPSDTSALAAILCDYGYFNATQYQFTRILRIKIFKKEGTSWGNQAFPTNTKADIHGITYNLENGEIVESKLKSESIFMERVTEDFYRTRVAMPNVKEGSIIDIEFTYNGLPSEWRFQEEVPVRWSELIIEPSQFITFQKSFVGFGHLSESNDMRWVAKEMPAFQKEPYMSSTKNYLTKFDIELLSIHYPPRGYLDISTTWEAVNKRLLESNYFGRSMEGCSFLNNIAKEIEKKFNSPLDRLKAAQEYVKKAVKWNDIESVASSGGNLSIAFNKKVGNSGDVNLMLIQLLKRLDFEVYPIALSTRSNGFLSLTSPSLRKLNYVVAYVLLDNKKYFLDATEEFLPVGMLPERCLNIQGRIIDEKKSEWIDLTTDRKLKKSIQFDMKIEAENVLSGRLTTANYDYAALNFRKKYEKFNSKEEYMRDFEKEHKGLSIISCDIANLDSIYLPLRETYEIKVRNAITNTGNMVYINPLLFEQMTSNPFKTEDRKYPVDFAYPSEKTYIFRLELPEGAQVIELPKPLSMKLENGSASLKYQFSTMDRFVLLNYKFVVNKTIFTEGEYGDLRALFSELVKKQAEQIVIKTL